MKKSGDVSPVIKLMATRLRICDWMEEGRISKDEYEKCRTQLVDGMNTLDEAAASQQALTGMLRAIRGIAAGA